MLNFWMMDPVFVPLWASWLRDFDILNIFYDELKNWEMANLKYLSPLMG